MSFFRHTSFLFMLASVFWVAQAQAVSLEEEIKLGTEEHLKIVARFGVYRDPELSAYVTRVGERIAKESNRPDLKYTFTILNDEEINAFAVPGGFVYVTRGILMHLNSESELAAVLGHEIAHVTEKHAFRSKTRGQILNAATSIGAFLVGLPGVKEIGDMASEALLMGYSRDFELEADAVGAEYMAKAGYSPEAMLRTIEILKNKDRVEIMRAREEQREPRVYHGFLSTHPDNDTRYKEAVRASMAIHKEEEEYLRSDEFLEKLNGLAIGPARKTGIVRKDVFYHPRLGIKMTFPDGWRIETTSRGIVGFSTTADAALTFTTAKPVRGQSLEEYLRKSMALDIREGREVTVAGMKGYLAIVDRMESGFGPRPSRVLLLADSRRPIMYLFQGSGKHDLRKIAADREFIATIFSFDTMSREELLTIKEPRLQVLRVEAGTTMEELAEQSPITSYPLQTLRVINGLYPDGEPEEGQLIKVID